MSSVTVFIPLFACASLVLGAAGGHQEVFQITGVARNADFDQAAILKLDSLKTPFPKGSSYPIADLPVRKGNFTLIKLICPHWGDTSEGTRLVHDLLVLKTDGKQIVDAYLYTLEWQDAPSARLARMTAKNVALRPELRLSALGMRRSNGEAVEGEALLDNVYRAGSSFDAERSASVAAISGPLEIRCASGLWRRAG